MNYSQYDSNGNLITSGASGGGSLVYNRLDIGVLLLNQAYPGAGVYDFRVPGDSNNNTFKYRFPRAGYVLGVSMTGTVSTTIQGGAYVQRQVNATGSGSDVMTPSDPGNTQTFDQTIFTQKGAIIMAPTPVPYAIGDIANMKFWASQAVTVSLSGFLIVGLVPQ